MSKISTDSVAEPAPSAVAILTLGIFLTLLIGVGRYLTMQGVDFAFYQLPAPVAALPADIAALILSRDKLNKAIEHFPARSWSQRHYGHVYELSALNAHWGDRRDVTRDGKSREAFENDLNQIARSHGITNWETMEESYEVIGRGLKIAGVAPYGHNWLLDDELLRKHDGP